MTDNMMSGCVKIAALIWLTAGLTGCAAASPADGIETASSQSSVPSDQLVIPRGQVVIKRDGNGIPHIFANGDYGLYYGYGYSLAEDRLYQLEILRRSSQGRVAEVLGKDYLSFDQKQRSLVWPARIKKQIEALNTEQRNIFRGYADGVNKRIVEVMAEQGTLLPLEFTQNDFMPEQWSEYDVVMLFVGTMLLRYGDFNTELENQNFLDELIEKHGQEKAWTIFNAVIPRDHDLAPTTIASSEWKAKTSPKPLASSSTGKTVVDGIAPQISGFSNAFLLSSKRLTGAKAILVNGPQFGWYIPGYTSSFGFHTPTWNAVGNSPVGYPLVQFGYNDNISWGSTWGASDNVDIYRETLNPQNSEEYRHNGKWKKLEKREEAVAIKDQDSVSFVTYRSIHGPIINYEPQASFAFSKRRGWMGRELDTLLSWIDATRAQNHGQWREAVSRSALNVNWYYADEDGNIAYFAGGAYPERAEGHDNRLPVSGEGRMDWRGILPSTENPQILNPEQGYIANWNNKPGAGFTNPDEWWYSWSEADRVEVLNELIEQAGPMDSEQAWSLMIQAAYVDPNVKYFKSDMVEALHASSDPRAAELATLLEDWNGSFAERDRSGSFAGSKARYVEPANAIFRIWLGEMLRETLADDLPGQVGGAIAGTTAYGTPENPFAAGLNISVGTKLLLEALRGRTTYDFFNGQGASSHWQKTLLKTLDRLEVKYGRNVQSWKLEVPATRFSAKNFMGIPQTLAKNQIDHVHEMNRGTENNMTVFRENEAPLGFETTPPGQSGFIAPDGTESRHYTDQLDQYAQHGKREIFLQPTHVIKNSRSSKTLSLPQK